MADDEQEALFKSMVEERILLLARLKAHQDRWDEVIEVTENPAGRPSKLRDLLRIRAIAEEALTL